MFYEVQVWFGVETQNGGYLLPLKGRGSKIPLFTGRGPGRVHQKIWEFCNIRYRFRRRMCAWTRSVARELIPIHVAFKPARVNPIKLAYDTRQPDGRPHSDQRL